VPRDIFREVVDPTPTLGARSRFAVPLSMAAHAVLAAAVIIVPLMATDAMPDPRRVIDAFRAPAALPVPPPPPAAPSHARQSDAPSSSDAAPRESPASIDPEPETTSSALPRDPGGVFGGLPDGVVGAIGVAPGLPSVPAPPPVTQPMPVGGKIRPPAKVRHVPPIYPAIAQQARVEGIVIIEAVIGVDGRVKQARVLRSKPLLDEATLAAVRQWEFSPTTLNGVAVPVIMTVTVNFTLR
jgi:protein TonB